MLLFCVLLWVGIIYAVVAMMVKVGKWHDRVDQRVVARCMEAPERWAREKVNR